jgi:hypothetical protein
MDINFANRHVVVTGGTGVVNGDGVRYFRTPSPFVALSVFW